MPTLSVCAPAGIERWSESSAVHVVLRWPVAISCVPDCSTVGTPLLPGTVTRTSGCLTVGRKPESSPLYPTSSSLDAPLATLEMSWIAADRLSTQRECCSDDNGKQALAGQFAGPSVVGRAKIELSACP